MPRFSSADLRVDLRRCESVVPVSANISYGLVGIEGSGRFPERERHEENPTLTSPSSTRTKRWPKAKICDRRAEVLDPSFGPENCEISKTRRHGMATPGQPRLTTTRLRCLSRY